MADNENYWGVVRLKNPRTIKNWKKKGWFQANEEAGYLFGLGCGRFVLGGCTCAACKRKNKHLKIEAMKEVNFREALKALNEGKRICRKPYISSGMFMFKQVPARIDKAIVPNMQSLPQAVKDEFVRRFNDEKEEIDAIYYDNQLAIVNRHNLICGWAPSVAEIMAEDWVILD